MRLWLKVKILAAFGNQTCFAQKIGMRDDKLSRIVTGRIDPTDHEKILIAENLETSGEEIEILFSKHANK